MHRNKFSSPVIFFSRDFACECHFLFFSRNKDELQLMLRLQALTAANMKLTAFWHITPCSLVKLDRLFRGAYYLHH
jgi:hypothetical protein